MNCHSPEDRVEEIDRAPSPSEQDASTYILLIEDNAQMAAGISRGLAEHGFRVDHSTGGIEGEAKAVENPYAMIILDRRLPDRDGIEVGRNLRKRGLATPILLLTVDSASLSEQLDPSTGPDDWLLKPFDFDELLRRIRLLLHRKPVTESFRLKYGDLEFDMESGVATRAGRSIRLSGIESSLLKYLINHPDRSLAPQAISQQALKISHDSSSNALDTLIASLRRKLDHPGLVPLIHARGQAGYLFGISKDDQPH